MSRGPGIVQQRIMQAFQSDPARRFTVEDLAGVVYPGQPIGRSQTEAVRRALKLIGPTIGLHMSRAGRFGARGWRYVVGIT